MANATIEQEKTAVARWRADPVLGARELLGAELTPKQAEIVRSVWQNPVTCVPSGHGTGKTYVAAVILHTYLQLYPNSRVITLANSATQVRKALWAEVHRLHRQAPIPLSGELLQTEIRISSTHYAIGMSPEKPDSIHGQHADFTLVIVDECINIEDDMWQAIYSLMSTSNCRLLAIANPTKISSRFYRMCNDRNRNSVIRLSCLDHPNVVEGRQVIPGAVTREQVKSWRDEYGEESQEYAVRVLGEFPKSDGYTLISRYQLEEAARYYAENGRTHCGVEEPHMGVDPSAGSIDKTCVYVTRDGVPVYRASFMESDTRMLAGELIKIAKEYGVKDENIHVDAIGIGRGLLDALFDSGMSVDEVQFSGKPQYEWDVVAPETLILNRRAELYWVARERIRRKDVAIPEEYNQLWDDLTAPTYKHDSRSNIVLEPKDQIRKRLGRSPDDGDAYVLSMSRLGAGLGVF